MKIMKNNRNNQFTKKEKLTYWKKNMESALKTFQTRNGWNVEVITRDHTWHLTCGGSSYKDIGHVNHAKLFADKFKDVVASIQKYCAKNDATIMFGSFNKTRWTKIMNISKRLDRLELTDKSKSKEYIDLNKQKCDMYSGLISSVIVGVTDTEFDTHLDYMYEYVTYVLDYAIDHLAGINPDPKDYLLTRVV